MTILAASLLTFVMVAEQIPDWAGTWLGSLTNYPVKEGAKRIDVTLEIGPFPIADNTCSRWRTTYLEEGTIRAVKDYKLCRGKGPDDLFTDENNGVKLPARLLGGALVTPFKYGDVLLISTVRGTGDRLEEEIVTVGDKPAQEGVLPLEARGIQRMVFHRVASSAQSK